MLLDGYTQTTLIAKNDISEFYKATKEASSETYLIRKLDKKKLENAQIKPYLDQELEILKKLNHPNIVNLIELRENADSKVFILDYCNGGELGVFLEKYFQKNKKGLPEEIVQYIMRQIIDGINYLHNNDIMHRDLKLDNLYIHYDDENDKKNNNIIKAKIKINDFGFAKFVKKGDLTTTVLGSPLYMAPIILTKLNSDDKSTKMKGYNHKVDIWSIGMICYELLVGKTPFNAEDMDELVHKVNEGNYYLPVYLSKESISFLNSMLQYEENKRLSAEQLVNHEFLKKDVKEFTKLNLEEMKNHILLKINTKDNEEISKILGNGI